MRAVKVKFMVQEIFCRLNKVRAIYGGIVSNSRDFSS
jgi:hypothetical protein